MPRVLSLASCAVFATLLAGGVGLPLKYFAIGNPDNRHTPTQPGYALIGGASDNFDFFRWLIRKSQGGDFLVLRASGGDSYNHDLFQLGGLHSVATLVIDTPEAARHPSAVAAILHAEAIFLAGGDQWNYVRLWNHSPVGNALNRQIARGVPVGGTSAGLAVLGEYVFTAEHDTVTSPEALANPFHPRVTLARNFLHIPVLRNTVTDSHFHARDRMGRTLVFLARMLHDRHLPEARALAVDEKTAALVDADGHLRIAGASSVYFLRARNSPEICAEGLPLTLRNIEVYRASDGDRFDLAHWTGSGGSAYRLSVAAGLISSTQPGGAVY